MEQNNQINELIARYLTNDLNDEEHALVVAWIDSSEENRRYFINVKNTWQLTSVKLSEQVNEQEEWKLFKETLAARDGKVASMNEQETGNGIVYRRLLRVAVAAGLVITMGLGWLYFNKQHVPQTAVKDTFNKQESTATVLQHEVNTSGKEKNIQLADGSMIVLYNNSELVYEKPFITRHIKLTGKAFFKVAHDASKPFTVESDAITTTDLGTEFMIDASATQKQISVRLYNGKVVIRPTHANKVMNGEAYLLPGQEFIYGPTSFTIRSFRTNNQNPGVQQEETVVNDNPSLPVNTKGSWLMYNNQALSQVLDHLASTYGVTIMYEAKDVQQKYFVGQFKTTDSIEMILNLITKANKLKYTREENTFIIHR